MDPSRHGHDTQQPAALRIDGLTASYRQAAVLSDVSCAFPQGAMSAIVGPNGAGKSTLMLAALGLLPRRAGTVSILGKSGPRARRQVAYVPQRETIDWDFPITVREVVEMGRYPSRGWVRRLRRDDHETVSRCLERLGITGLERRQVGELSGGQRQRVFVARALAQQAPVLMLDEPFTGIDKRTEGDLMALLRELADAGSSIIVVHHDIPAVRRDFDHALLLNVRALACGPVDTVLTSDRLEHAYGGRSIIEDAP